MHRWLLALVLVGCTPANAPHETTSCESDDDCDGADVCQCRGVGADPCFPEMKPGDCAKARCGGKICIDPKHPPPPPP